MYIYICICIPSQDLMVSGSSQSTLGQSPNVTFVSSACRVAFPCELPSFHA